MTRSELLALIPDPRLREACSDLSDEELRALHTAEAGPFEANTRQCGHLTFRPQGRS